METCWVNISFLSIFLFFLASAQRSLLVIDERRLKSLCDSQNAAYDQLKYTHIPYWDQFSLRTQFFFVKLSFQMNFQEQINSFYVNYFPSSSSFSFFFLFNNILGPRWRRSEIDPARLLLASGALFAAVDACDLCAGHHARTRFNDFASTAGNEL